MQITHSEPDLSKIVGEILRSARNGTEGRPLIDADERVRVAHDRNLLEPQASSWYRCEVDEKATKEHGRQDVQ